MHDKQTAPDSTVYLRCDVKSITGWFTRYQTRRVKEICRKNKNSAWLFHFDDD